MVADKRKIRRREEEKKRIGRYPQTRLWVLPKLYMQVFPRRNVNVSVNVSVNVGTRKRKNIGRQRLHVFFRAMNTTRIELMERYGSLR